MLPGEDGELGNTLHLGTTVTWPVPLHPLRKHFHSVYRGRRAAGGCSTKLSLFTQTVLLMF